MNLLSGIRQGEFQLEFPDDIQARAEREFEALKKAGRFKSQYDALKKAKNGC